MTCDIFEFDTGQTNILGLCYLLGKTYKQPTVAPLKSLKSTHSTKLLHLLRWTIRHQQPSRLFHNDTQFKQRFRCKQSLRLKYAIIKLKPGFHMIATIAVIAEKKITSAIAAIQPAKTSVSPRSSPLGTLRAEERRRLRDRNSILMTQINVYSINPVVGGFQM